MGLFDFAKKTSPNHQKMAVPSTVNPKKISTKKQKTDLLKLKAFEEKIKKSEPEKESIKRSISQEEMALKLQNPFRGV